jgi:UDP-galactopyranose mutase
MAHKVDYLVIGSGLTGAVIARMLADRGRDVLIVDRRSHVGGNVHDHSHESGIRIHTYGPHYFRTSSERIWDFVTRFGEFYKYEAALMSVVNGAFVRWPLSSAYIESVVGKAWQPSFRGPANNFEEAALSLMPRCIYETFVKEYNEKQWGVPASSLSAELCKRFDVRADDEPRLKPDAKHQGLPVLGYEGWMQSLLRGIPVRLNTDFLSQRPCFSAKKFTIFTGPIDEYFGFDLGKLHYRGQMRKHSFFSNESYVQPCAQVNNPTHAGGAHIRTIEWKHLMPQEASAPIRGTVVTSETPFSPTDPSGYEYPFPDGRNAQLYAKYRQRANSIEQLLVAGRLGEYRYLDMDQAIGRAMVLAEQLLASE